MVFLRMNKNGFSVAMVFKGADMGDRKVRWRKSMLDELITRKLKSVTTTYSEVCNDIPWFYCSSEQLWCTLKFHNKTTKVIRSVHGPYRVAFPPRGTVMIFQIENVTSIYPFTNKTSSFSILLFSDRTPSKHSICYVITEHTSLGNNREIVLIKSYTRQKSYKVCTSFAR